MIISYDYLLSEFSYIDGMLKLLPEYSVGKHLLNGVEHEVIRMKSKYATTGRKEMRFNSAPDNIKYQARFRQALLYRKKELLSEWSQYFKGDLSKLASKYKLRSVKTELDESFFAQAEDQYLPIEKSDANRHGKYWMRSRAEINIAKDLEALGLRYKYEVNIPWLNRTADFLVYIPILKCCIILEYLGMTDKPSYMSDNAYKVHEYLSCKMRLNYEFAFLSGTKSRMPTQGEVQGLIALCIKNLCDERLELIE